jgi:two-component system, cell cycle response regulator DivK
VLLVDQDSESRMLYAGWLTMSGCQVEQAHNGFQALERAFDRRPDLVMTELYLPGIDGFELTRRLKGDPRTADVPVLAVTGFVPFMDPARAHLAGCDAILAKSCTWSDLERAIDALLSASRRRHSA